MYGPLALLVLATAAFPLGVVRWRLKRRPRVVGRGRVDLEQVQGFVYVGSGALAVLGVGVVVLGLAGRPGQGEAMAALGLIAYLAYLLVALFLIRRTSRRGARRAAPPAPHVVTPDSVAGPPNLRSDHSSREEGEGA